MRVLDVGCGDGSLGAALTSLGNACYGITISECEAAIARQQMAQVQVLDIESADVLPYPEQSFDVVIFADVLEHLRCPGKVLNLVKPYLKPGGMVVASIPNVAHISVRWGLLRGRFHYAPSGILDETHLRFYTLKTAKALIESAGYLIREVRFRQEEWIFPRAIRRALWFCEWEIRHLPLKLWPGLFSVQFVIYATPRGERVVGLGCA